MKSAEIRDSFIQYFAERGHRRVASAPLVPHGDPTLLFTNAGMVQFKDYFLGSATPGFPRAVTAQKCMRVSGKHNDLENVGPSPRHHTFFEMLGNFSFGDYFKAEAIDFGWDLVTRVWGLPADRLFATVFEEDDEAFDLWLKVSGLSAERVRRCGVEDNFWAMGETGPCGPCSEIFVDLHPERPHEEWEDGTESGRYLEIWNLVFMQLDRAADGSTTPLPKPSIDTGAGLERLAAVLQGVESNYDSDLFQPILAAAAALAGRRYGESPEVDVSLRVVADHLRAVTFLLADGVIPGNEGRGYVLRRVLRRAVRHGMGLGFEEPFLHRLVPVVGEVLGGAYPELGATERASSATVEAEEAKFLSTVAVASRQVQEAVEEARERGTDTLAGATLFRFYDTYGLPLELLREIAEEERIGLDEEGFQRALEEQRARSRAAGAGGKDLLARAASALRLGDSADATVLPAGGEAAGGAPSAGPATSDFVGYDRLVVDEAEILAVARERDGRFEAAETLASGESGVVSLAPTPFYAEAGGQVGDRGTLSWEGGEADVIDTQKDGSEAYLHFVRVIEGRLTAATVVAAAVDAGLRRPTERNHTGTHLLHAALRHVLGEGVRQAGSLVAPDRLRFDFTYPGPVAAEDLRRIEEIVNRWVLEAEPTRITADRPFQEAVQAGAMALFGEKYGDLVRTVEVPGGVGSLELCGGCHVRNVGEIGPFLIVSEKGIASGVRRIEALTGEGALAELRERGERLERAAAVLGVPPERLAEEVERERGRLRDLERELSSLRMRLVSGAETAEEGAREVEGINVLAREVPPAPPQEMRTMADLLRGRLGSGVVVLASRRDDKVSLVAAVSPDLTDRLHAGKLAQAIAERLGGKGGGRPDFAQAGGRDVDALPQALAEVPDHVRTLLAASAVARR
jgi:alanyl-tRNA synthetase